MKASLIALSCILFGVVACAPQGKKLAANDSGLVPVASGPTTPPTAAAAVSEAQQGQFVGVIKNGTVTVTLEAAAQSGYSWRLSEIPDPTVLKMVSQDFVPPTDGTGRGQEKWVFQAVGPGDVDVKMWYGNLTKSPMDGNQNFNFIASVSEETQPVKKSKKSPKKA